MIRFACPQCGARCKAPLKAVGRSASCKKCGGAVRVPGPAVPSPADTIRPTPQADAQPILVVPARPLPAAQEPPLPVIPVRRRPRYAWLVIILAATHRPTRDHRREPVCRRRGRFGVAYSAVGEAAR
jgi:hypothetical protein